MKFLLALAMIGLLVTGCASHQSQKAPVLNTAVSGSGNSAATPKIITPDNSLSATVISYDSVGRFVILSFPIGQMPELNQTFFLYRAGLKVGEVKISGPQRDNNIVADLVTGDAQPGDEVRDQ
jgi:hypothetical protein